MLAVILLAGKGRRIRDHIGYGHKALLNINGHPILWYLINNLRKCGITDIISVLGYRGSDIEGYLRKSFHQISFQFCVNDNYETTNNLASLMEVERLVKDTDFIVLNGDMVFDYHILKKIMAYKQSAIAIDFQHAKLNIDSPCTIIEQGKISDLGRDIDQTENDGYAIGIYKFSSEIASDYFDSGRRMLLENPQAGFHDPLRNLFDTYEISACDIGKCLWTDVDDVADIRRAEQYIQSLYGIR